MSVTAKFVADFTSFQTAVEKAELSLKSLEGGANRAGASLTRMVDSLSGQKVVQEAMLAAEAVERIGGVSKLTEAELSKLGARATEAIAKLKAMGQDVPQGIQQIADAANRLNTNLTETAGPVSRLQSGFGDLVGQVKATALGFISAQAVISGVQAGVRALIGFVSSSVDAFAASEAASKKLTAALASQGLAVPGLKGKYDELASQFEKTTGFADDLLTEMQALLVQIGNVGPAEMEKALSAATDLAAGLGVDLRTATMLVGKAFEGETGTLKKYGIVIDEAKLKTEGVTAVLDAVQQKFGGQAAGQVDTYAGKINALANAWDNLQESIGELVTQNPIVLAALNALTDAAGKNGIAVEDASHSWSDFLESVGASGLATGVRLLESYADAANKDAAAFREAEVAHRSMASAMGNIERDLAAAAANKARLAEIKAIKDKKDALEAAEKADKSAHEAAMLRGLKAIKFYEDTVKKQKEIETQTAAVNLQMGILVKDRLEALGTRGQTILKLTTEEAVRFGLAMSGNIPVIDGLSRGLTAMWEASATGIKPIPPLLKTFKTDLSDLSTALSNLSQVAGGSFGSLASGFATLVNSASAAKTAIAQMKEGFAAGWSKDGLLGMATGISGIISAAAAAVNAVKALWSVFDRNKGRDAVEDFAKSFGGFDALHAKLLQLGDDGEALWVKLTQGVGRNNPEQAARVIAEVEAALARQAEAQGDVTGATEEQAQASIETATQAAQALDELGPRLKTNEDEWRSWGAVVTDQIKSSAAAVRALPLPSPSPLGGSTGGYQPSQGGWPGSGGDTVLNTRITSVLDGQILGEAFARQVFQGA